MKDRPLGDPEFVIGALRRENAEKDKRIADLELRLKDWHDSAEAAWKTPCDDEKHCSCVPLLRKTLDDKDRELADLKAESATLQTSIETLICEEHRNVPDLHAQHEDLGGGCLFCLSADLKARVEELALAVEASVEMAEEAHYSEMAYGLQQTLSRTTLGASDRLREKHYRECEEIAERTKLGTNRHDASVDIAYDRACSDIAATIARSRKEGTSTVGRN